ncbi:hypothetical protein [Nocardia noduli]|uniref:hypothetical protein n=1 Tax=Nocardia noduli TaxID=2815722 RepID=UPI001C248C96|nr:hypothetical protein [Nocardia noduli]
MEVHAYPTEATVPVDLAEARRIADLHLRDPDDAADDIGSVVTEFDAGFTVAAVRGTAEAGRLPKPAIGGSVCVIDKSTGAISFWPTYPTALIAEQYAVMRDTGRLVVEDSWPDPEDFDLVTTATGEDVDDAVLAIDYESS